MGGVWYSGHRPTRLVLNSIPGGRSWLASVSVCRLSSLQMAEGSGGNVQKMNAILIGATGATGRCLLGSLLRAKVRNL